MKIALILNLGLIFTVILIPLLRRAGARRLKREHEEQNVVINRNTLTSVSSQLIT